MNINNDKKMLVMLETTTALRRQPIKHPTVFADMTDVSFSGRNVLGAFENDTVVQSVALPLPKLDRLRNYLVTVPV